MLEEHGDEYHRIRRKIMTDVFRVIEDNKDAFINEFWKHKVMKDLEKCAKQE